MGEAAIYAKADIEDPSKVFLWLGANVMLEYPLAEANQLLENNLDNYKKIFGPRRPRFGVYQRQRDDTGGELSEGV